MGQREPFAKIIRYPESEGLCLYVGGELVADSAYVEFTPEIITYLCEKINDTHEARVKEEVRKAVEEFRMRAVIVIRDVWRNVPVGGVVGIMDFEEKIGGLPTEPEGMGHSEGKTDLC